MDMTIVIGVGMFTAIVLALVVIIYARTLLVSSGDVNIEINGEKTITVPAGGKLLQTLSESNIFLASACGGGGTCAQCKCIVSRAAAPCCRRKSPFHPPRRQRGLAPVLPDRRQAGHEDRGARGSLRRQAVGVHGAKAIPTSPPSSRNWCWAAPRRERGFPRRRLRADRVPAAPGPLRISISRRSTVATGSASGSSSSNRSATKHDPRLLHGQLPGRKGHHHAQRPRRHAAARTRGHPPGHHVLLHLQPEARRQGQSPVPSASSSPRTRTRRWCSSAAARAWRRCARTSSISSSG
jgi:ferredoxin